MYCLCSPALPHHFLFFTVSAVLSHFSEELLSCSPFIHKPLLMSPSALLLPCLLWQSASCIPLVWWCLPTNNLREKCQANSFFFLAFPAFLLEVRFKSISGYSPQRVDSAWRSCIHSVAPVSSHSPKTCRL